MILWDDLSDEEQSKLIEAAKPLAAAMGSSVNGVLADILRVMNAKIISASAIPAHLFAESERVASKPLRAKWR